MGGFSRAWQALATRLGPRGTWWAPFTPGVLRLLLVLGGVGALGWFILRDHGLLDHARLRRTLDSLETRSLHLESQITWYRERNQRLQENDPFTLEEEARRMGMVRPGEEVHRVVLPADTAARREE